MKPAHRLLFLTLFLHALLPLPFGQKSERAEAEASPSQQPKKGQLPDPQRLRGGVHVNNVSFWPKGDKVFFNQVTTVNDAVLFQRPVILDLETGGVSNADELAKNRGELLISPNGEMALVLCDDGPFILCDTKTGKQIRAFEMQSKRGHVRALAWSADSTRILSGSLDKTVRLWDAASAKVIKAFSVDLDIDVVSLSPDGEFALCATHTYLGDPRLNPPRFAVQVWNISRGTMAAELEGHPRTISAIKFSPSGKLALTLSRDGTVTLWNIPSWKKRNNLELTIAQQKALGSSRDNPLTVSGAVFTPDGRHVVTCGDGYIRLWEIATGQLSLSFEVDKKLSHYSIAVLPHGKSIVTQSSSSFVLWDLHTGKRICALFGND